MIKGKAWKFGDNVDTDVIIPARHLTSTDPDVLKEHCMEDLDPEFAGKVSSGDIMVGGTNFGCGSSREHAPLAIKSAGISCIIAGSFARIFFRNSVNMGLPILESAEAADDIETGDEIEVDLATGRIKNPAKDKEYQAEPVPEFMQELIEAGGLISFAKKRLDQGLVTSAVEKKQEKKKEEPEKKRKPGDRMKELEEEAEAGVAAPWGEEVSDEDTPDSEREEEELEQGESDEDEEEINE